MKRPNNIALVVISVLLAGLYISPWVSPATAHEGEPHDDLVFGQSHNYNVHFRGNGEAYVYASVAMENPGDRPLDEVPLEFVGFKPQELAAFQQFQSTDCPDGRPCPVPMDDKATSGAPSAIYPGITTRYERVDYRTEGERLIFKLPQPVAPKQSGTLMLAYATSNYTQNTLGVYEFKFVTLKALTRVNQAFVSVNVDSDLYLDGARSEVQYRSMPEGADQVAPSSLSADNAARAFGYFGYGQLTKEAKNLAAGETLTVTGRYATSWWRLNMWRLATALAVVLTLLGLVWLVPPHLAGKRLGSVTLKTAAADSFWHPPYVMSGLVAALLVGVIGIGFKAWQDYRYQSDPALGLIVGVIVFLAIVLAIVGPLALMARQRGWKSLLAGAVWELIWLCLLAGLYLVMFPPIPTPKPFI